MSSRRTTILWLTILLFVVLFVLRTVYLSGAFKTIANQYSGTTKVMEGIAGVEDIDIDYSTGIAFLSSDDRWARALKKEPRKGGIYALNLNDSVPVPVNLTDGFDQPDFHPHGISFYESPEGKKLLFVVNHRDSGNFIEVFQYRNDTLHHLERITDSLMISPNDVVGVGDRQFYFTNDHAERPGTVRSLKDLATIGTGNVGYFDGEKTVITSVEGIKYANGINVSKDGSEVYLAATTDRKVYVFNRDKSSGALTLAREIETGTGVDNIDIDENGNLWVGCHPQLLKFLSHAKDESKISPSEVIKLTRQPNGSFAQTTVYMNDGSELSASSVAAVFRNKLLIGPVFQRRFVLAESNPN
jgi:arylesterase/paraoxonase